MDPISTLMKYRLQEGKPSEKMNKYNRLSESLKVCVSQAVWDNLSPSVHVRLQDVKMQKVRLCLKAYLP